MPGTDRDRQGQRGGGDRAGTPKDVPGVPVGVTGPCSPRWWRPGGGASWPRAQQMSPRATLCRCDPRHLEPTGHLEPATSPGTMLSRGHCRPHPGLRGREGGKERSCSPSASGRGQPRCALTAGVETETWVQHSPARPQTPGPGCCHGPQGSGLSPSCHHGFSGPSQLGVSPGFSACPPRLAQLGD